MISLITPSYNSSSYIGETYQSIIGQSYSNWEWIIVDDGSTDDTLELLKKYSTSDSRIRFYKREKLPKGATTCRNMAIEKSNGIYLLFLDTDDILASFCLKQRVEEMQKNAQYDFIVFQMMLFQQQIDDTRLLWNIEDERDNLERAIRLNPVMAGSSTIWKKESFIKIGMWDEKILINQDIELHIRSLAYGLQYKLRLDLPPDLFVRNNLQSISRARKKPIEKQLSRVYFFQKIREHIHKNSLILQYREALHWLFMKLLFDILYDREITVAKKLYFQNIDFVQSLPFSYKFMLKLLLIGGNQSYRLIGWIRKINRISPGTSKNQTFGKRLYEGEIVR